MVEVEKERIQKGQTLNAELLEDVRELVRLLEEITVGEANKDRRRRQNKKTIKREGKI